MKKLDNKIFMDCRSKMEGFILCKCKDISYYRRKPPKEKIAFSAKMQQQQERVAGIAAIHQAMKAVGINGIWTKAAKPLGLNGYNLLVRTNSPAFSGEGEISDFEKLTLTTGRLQLPDHLQMSAAEDGEIVFTWENNPNPYPITHDSDRLVIALMKKGRSFTIKLPNIGDWERKHCRAVIRLPTELKAYSHLYCFFCSATGEEVSRSKYFNSKLNSNK